MEAVKDSKGVVFGFDYGTRARMRILGDTAFEGLLRRGLLGLTYEFGATAALLANVPALVLIFRSLDTARECFERFHSWQKTTGSGDAVGLMFIEHPNGEFTICLYEEIELFLRAVIPDELRDDLEPHYGSAVYSMRFRNQSDGYRSFKVAIQKSPFLLVPATKTLPPLWEMAIAKRTIGILEETSVPENSRAASVLRAHVTVGSEERSSGAPFWPADIATLHGRRRTQLRRFYPVSLEQLRRNSGAEAVTEVLKARGYRAWQIEQAICNLNWSRRLDDAHDRSPDDEIGLMATLASTWERAELFSRALDLDLERLEVQLRADGEQLLDFTGVDTGPDSSDLQRLLAERGLLDVQA